MLNIAKTIYAGWDIINQTYELPEAEVIPLGESVSEKKKLDKVTRKYTSLFEHDNVPLPGFTLYKADRRNWGSGDYTWLVIDPRGFLVRITSQNLEKILHVTGITEGLIQEKCVWARENSEVKLTLVPVSSNSYVEAVQNTKLLESKVCMKDVQIGDSVLLQNKMTGVYKGVASLYGPIESYSYDPEHKPVTRMRKQIIEVSEGRYYYQNDLKILKVLNKIIIAPTRQESIARMNKHIEDGIAVFSNSEYGLRSTNVSMQDQVRHVSTYSVPKVLLTFEEVDINAAGEVLNSAALTSDIGMLMLEDSAGSKFIIDYPYYMANSVSAVTHSFNVTKLIPMPLDKREKLILAEKRQSIFGSSRLRSCIKKLDNFTKFYKIIKHVKDATYI